MEVPRLMLAIAGKFPGAGYEDGRFSEPPAGLEHNLGRMPVASIGEETFGQSGAINFVIASECGLMGSSIYEAGHILSVSEHIKEMAQGWSKLVPWGTEPTEENLELWFNGGAKDVTGTADGQGASTRYLTWWAGRIEAILGTDGFAVGGKLSLADVLLYYLFAETLADDQAAPDFPNFRKEPFGSKARTDEFLTRHPRIKASCDAVANHANVKKWLSERGVQGF
jgi:glutathione S-transferase